MISPSVLAGLRASTAAFRPEPWTLERVTETSTADGITSGWTVIASGATGARISTPGRSASEATGGAESIRASGQRVIWLPFGTDVTPKDRVTVGARRFEVVDVDPFSYAVECRLDCLELF